MALILGDEFDNDRIGTTGADVARLFEGNDHYHSNGGADRVFCGEGNDRVELGSGGSMVYGGSGDDHVDGGSDADVLHGGSGADTLWGGFGGADQVFGEGGNDTVFDSGTDYLDGGDGIDTISFRTSGAFVFTPGLAQVLLSGSTIVNFEVLNLTGEVTDDDFTGGARGDLIRGWSGNDIVNGMEGNDFLIGDNGNDTLHGGSGHDRLNGGGHDDHVFGGNGDDILAGGGFNDLFAGEDWLEGGRGADTFNGSNGDTNITYLNSNRAVTINLHTYQASGGHATGDTINALVNIIEGSAFADTLTGGREQRGGEGDDTLIEAGIVAEGGGGLDSFIFTTLRVALSSASTVQDLDVALGEKIDLSAIDASAEAGDQAFTFIGTDAFGEAPGEMRYEVNETLGYTLLTMRVDDSGQLGYLIIDGIHALTGAEFIL